MKEEYYKAYDKRYKQIYDLNLLWEKREPTKEVIDVINKYNINKNDKILDLGCGEGRDSIYLLDKGYDVLAVDYSVNVINKCNELTNNKYINNFKQFDLIKDKLNDKYKFIYSIAVLHMFVEDSHRNSFYKFIYNHLEENGIALIICMGDGIKEYKSNIEEAFNDTKRVNTNNNDVVNVVSTSCCIKNIDNIKEEIKNNNLNIIDISIVDDLPNFDKCICVVVKKDK